MPGRALAAAVLLASLTRAAWAGSTPPSVALPPSVPAAAGPPAAGEDPLTVSVLTFGPGDHPFLKFGHDAIWIHDASAGTDRVYNFGTFKFDSPRLIFDFLGGRMMYWLSVSTLPAVLAEYRRENRSITAQTLDLEPHAKLALQRALELNARPESRAYKYDYFLDNCSTRVRDALARVGVPFIDRSTPARLTLREHALRMAADSVPFYIALDLVLGPRVDRRIDRWGEMFLPEEVAKALSVVRISRNVLVQEMGERGPAAPLWWPRESALVSQESRLFLANRPPPRQEPPAWAGWFFLAGGALGLGLFGLGAGATGRRWARVSFGTVIAIWGLLTGFVGCFLVYVWVFTDHVVAHRNQNILLCAPWAIALLILGVGVALGRPGAIRKAFRVSLYALAAALGACALKAGLAPRQANGDLIAFFLPAWLGVTAGLARLRAAQRS